MIHKYQTKNKEMTSFSHPHMSLMHLFTLLLRPALFFLLSSLLNDESEIMLIRLGVILSEVES